MSTLLAASALPKDRRAPSISDTSVSQGVAKVWSMNLSTNSMAHTQHQLVPDSAIQGHAWLLPARLIGLNAMNSCHSGFNTTVRCARRRKSNKFALMWKKNCVDGRKPEKDL
jgi:hypothetical protein